MKKHGKRGNMFTKNYYTQMTQTLDVSARFHNSGVMWETENTMMRETIMNWSELDVLFGEPTQV